MGRTQLWGGGGCSHLPPPPPTTTTGAVGHSPILQRCGRVVGQGHSALGRDRGVRAAPQRCPPRRTPSPCPILPSDPIYRVTVPGPGSPIGHKLALALSFLLPPICKLAQQRVRGGCGEGCQHHQPAPSHPAPPSVPPKPTWHPWGGLDVLPIKVGDDSLALLCGLHPGGGGRMAGGALLGVPRAYAAPSPFTLPQPHAAPYRAKPTPRLAPWGSRRMRVDTTCPKGFSSASSSCSSTPSGRLEM